MASISSDETSTKIFALPAHIQFVFFGQRESSKTFKKLMVYPSKVMDSPKDTFTTILGLCIGVSCEKLIVENNKRKKRALNFII